jgi:hypothetical protein
MRHVNILKSMVLAGALALVPNFADTWDKKTVITIDAPMQLPTITLQPGSYTMKLLDSPSNRHIVTVWDQDGRKHLTTVLAIPNYRLQPTGKSQFVMWETPAGQPQALRAWFYPGDNFGQEFAYPKDKAAEIASVTKQEVQTLTSEDESNLVTAEKKIEETTTTTTETQVAETPKPPVETAPVEIAQATPPAQPEPTPAPAPEVVESAPVAAATPAQTEPMPQTASNWTEVTLLGALAGFAGLFLVIKRLTV